MSSSLRSTAAGAAPATSSSIVSSTAYTRPSISTFPNAPPLTKTFTPPSSCLSGLYMTGGVGLVDVTTSCMPSGFDVAETAFFSPGIACPVGYVTACSDTAAFASITTVTCCPSRDDGQGGTIKMSCVKNPGSLAGAFANKFCTWAVPSGTFGTLTFTLSSQQGRTSTDTLTFSPGAGLNAWGVRMVFEASDVPKSTGTDDQQSTTSGTSSPTSSPTGSTSSGLSTGAIAAIAVVIPLLVIAALIGGFFFWRRRKSRAAQQGYGPPGGSPSGHDSAAAGAGAAGGPQAWYKMNTPQSGYTNSHSGFGGSTDGTQQGHGHSPYYTASPPANGAWAPPPQHQHPVELAGSANRAELPAQNVPVEAPAWQQGQHQPQAYRP